MNGVEHQNGNAAANLEGVHLPNGWTVGPLNAPDPAATGGYFSLTYPVTKATGEIGFLKVLNLARAFQSVDFVDQLRWLTAEYVAERDLCIMCGEARLSKVVVAIDHGSIQLDGYAIGGVSYIVFELATHDVRVAMSQVGKLDGVLQLEYLHNLALGLRQLHRRSVAHQDLKPSNFLLFPPDASGRSVGKIGDLGRAFRADTSSPHDSLPLPGDRTYAPPEQLYGHLYPDVPRRRFAADLYQLGSVGMFMLTGTTMNAYLAAALPPGLHWSAYGDSYETVLPYIDNAIDEIIMNTPLPFSAPLSDRVKKALRSLCEPDATKRGHLRSRKSAHVPSYSLDRYVAEFDLIAKRAAIELRNA